MEWFVAIGFVSALGVWCTLRVRREYLRQDHLSPLTIVGVWVLYVSHVVVTVCAAVTSRWTIPLDYKIAVVSSIVLIGVGGFLILAGIFSFRSFRRMSGMDTNTLVTTGVYRWSRNPQNVGWALVLVGIALVGRSGLALLMAGVFWTAFRAYVVLEEAFLERIFGDEYRDYKAWSHRYFGAPRKPPFVKR
jgi:protein-S-isoprenylcysteine O-methyltransferase Ste14